MLAWVSGDEAVSKRGDSVRRNPALIFPNGARPTRTLPCVPGCIPGPAYCRNPWQSGQQPCTHPKRQLRQFDGAGAGQSSSEMLPPRSSGAAGSASAPATRTTPLQTCRSVKTMPQPSQANRPRWLIAPDGSRSITLRKLVAPQTWHLLMRAVYWPCLTGNCRVQPSPPPGRHTRFSWKPHWKPAPGNHGKWGRRKAAESRPAHGHRPAGRPEEGSRFKREPLPRVRPGHHSDFKAG